jgi:hypothetical protein
MDLSRHGSTSLARPHYYRPLVSSPETDDSPKPEESMRFPRFPRCAAATPSDDSAPESLNTDRPGVLRCHHCRSGLNVLCARFGRYEEMFRLTVLRGCRSLPREHCFLPCVDVMIVGVTEDVEPALHCDSPRSDVAVRSSRCWKSARSRTLALSFRCATTGLRRGDRSAPFQLLRRHHQSSIAQPFTPVLEPLPLQSPPRASQRACLCGLKLTLRTRCLLPSLTHAYIYSRPDLV